MKNKRILSLNKNKNANWNSSDVATFISYLTKQINNLENDHLLKQPILRDESITKFLMSTLEITNEVTPFDYSLEMHDKFVDSDENSQYTFREK